MPTDCGWRSGEIFGQVVVTDDRGRFEDRHRADATGTIVAAGRADVDVLVVDADASTEEVEPVSGFGM